jgi:hypothetical protein
MATVQTASTLVLDDLAVVGLLLIGYGIWLVTSGTRVSELQIAQRAASFQGYSHVDAVQMAMAKADGAFGTAYVVLGVALQTLVYVVDIGWDNAFAPGPARAVTALFLLLFTGFFAAVAHRSLRPALVRRIVVDVARCARAEADGRGSWAKTAVPSREVLLGCAEYIGIDRRPGEPDEAYVRRAFRVKRTRSEREDFEPAGEPRAAALKPRERRKIRV